MKQKKHFLAIVSATLVAVPAFSYVTVHFSNAPENEKISVTSTPIDPEAAGNVEERKMPEAKIYKLINGHTTFQMTDTVPSYYTVEIGETPYAYAEFFAVPSDDLEVTISKNQDGYNYIVAGTDLMDGISAMKQFVASISRKFAKVTAGELQLEKSDAESLVEQYSDLHRLFIDINNDSPAAAYALLNIMDDSIFKEYLELARPAVEKSLLYPMVLQRLTRIEKQEQAEARMKEMQSGKLQAPDFTFPNQKGKKIKLSQFRGKWVVLDFWGTWCRWCVKGIPDMKLAYDKHKKKAEFIGMDCGDTKDAWLDGLKRYNMPWVQVYIDSKSDDYKNLMKDYGVTGFPTKVIIDPDGKIVDVVVGEDPEFYNKLDQLIK